MSRNENGGNGYQIPSLSNDKVSSMSPNDKGEILSSLTDYTIPTRKTRIVRVRRNSMGVEIGRSYADATPEKEINTSDEDMINQVERFPLSPLKPSSIAKRRSSLDTSINYKYEYNTDHNLDTKVSATISSSPIKTKIVRVRRNSLGVEIERTYPDASSNEDLSNSQSSYNSDRLPAASPSKTRFVRVHRNSLGVEIGRSYVDAPQVPMKEKHEITVVNPNMSSISNQRDTTVTSVGLSPVPSLGQSKPTLSLSSPSKISSPSKVASQRMKSLSRNVQMKDMEKSFSDLNKLDLPLSQDEADEGKGSNGEILARKKGARSLATVAATNLVPPVSPATARKVKILKARSTPKASADGSDNHFITSPSLRSRSMRMYPSTDNKPDTDDHQVQSLRLLRVLLGEDSAPMTKANVDVALEKHAELLRFQLQQKKKIKQRDETIQQEKKQQEEMTDNHTKQITKLNDDVAKQKLLMKTSLEIKDVEIGILTKEIEQKTVKIQQLAWRLAKERAAAKESKSIDPKVSDSQSVDQKDDSNSLLDLLNLTEQPRDLDDDDLSEATPLVGHTSTSSFNSPEKSRRNSSKDKEGDESSKYPMKTSVLKKKLEQAEGQLLIAKKSILVLEKQHQEMELDFEETLHESKSKVAQLKSVLTACNERRQVAEQMLRDLGKFDEAMLVKISRKPSRDLMSDISERGISMKVGAATTSESDISSASTKEHISLKKEVQSLKDQLDEAKSRSHKLEDDNEMNMQELKATMEAKAKLEAQLTNLQMKLKDCEAQLVAAKSRSAEKIKATATSLREIEKVTAECNVANQANTAKMASELKILQTELAEAQQAYTTLQAENKFQIEESTRTANEFEKRSSELKAKVLTVTSDKEKSDRDMKQYQIELDEARLLLQQSEEMISKYAGRLQEANVAVKYLEEKVANLSEQLKSKISIVGSGDDMSITSVEEIHTLLKEAQVQGLEYETKLDQVQLALQESEAMAEKYLAMLEDANTTLEQSEKLMKQYDKLQPNLLLNGSAADSEFTSGASESEGTDDLSLKSTHDLLAIASQRLYGIVNEDDTSNDAADDEISKSTSNVLPNNKPRGIVHSKLTIGLHHEHSEVSSTQGDDETGKGLLLHEWEKSRVQNEWMSKIVKLETELTERQIQLDGALYRIADLTRNKNDATEMDPHNGNVALIAEVKELKERVVIAEERYNAVIKKLTFLKETVLTVVDTELSIRK